jgi:peptidoglycan hydrolase CwlO-like protein
MEVMTILTMIGGVMLGIIGYFLKQTMTELKDVKQTAYLTATKLEVLERDYMLQLSHLNDKFDDLYDAVSDLTKEIKNLNQKIK